MLKNCIIILKHLEVKAGKQMNRGNLIEILKKNLKNKKNEIKKYILGRYKNE